MTSTEPGPRIGSRLQSSHAQSRCARTWRGAETDRNWFRPDLAGLLCLSRGGSEWFTPGEWERPEVSGAWLFLKAGPLAQHTGEVGPPQKGPQHRPTETLRNNKAGASCLLSPVLAQPCLVETSGEKASPSSRCPENPEGTCVLALESLENYVCSRLVGSQTAVGGLLSGKFHHLHPPWGVKTRPLLLQRGEVTAAGGPDVPVRLVKETHPTDTTRLLLSSLPAQDASQPCTFS